MTQTNETPPETRQNCRLFDVTLQIELRYRIEDTNPHSATQQAYAFAEDDHPGIFDHITEHNTEEAL